MKTQEPHGNTIFCAKTGRNAVLSAGRISLKHTSYTDSVREVTFISEKLMSCSAEEAKKAGQTYRRWKNGIAEGLARNEMGLKLSNGRMECLNNRIKTIIKDAYGYRNFERFRKRALLILWADLGR